MPAYRHHMAHDDLVPSPVGADLPYFVDLQTGHGQPMRQLLRGQIDGHVALQPGYGYQHLGPLEHSGS